MSGVCGYIRPQMLDNGVRQQVTVPPGETPATVNIHHLAATADTEYRFTMAVGMIQYRPVQRVSPLVAVAPLRYVSPAVALGMYIGDTAREQKAIAERKKRRGGIFRKGRFEKRQDERRDSETNEGVRVRRGDTQDASRFTPLNRETDDDPALDYGYRHQRAGLVVSGVGVGAVRVAHRTARCSSDS